MSQHKRVFEIGYAIPGMFWPVEQGWVFNTFRQSRTHVEVGAYCGRSLWATCSGMEHPSRVYAVDNFSETQVTQDWSRAVCSLTIGLIHEHTKARVTLIEKGSIDASREVPGPIDSVFIDGCHEYAECKADIEAWGHLVRPGGMIAGHDYWPVHSGVMDAVNETGEFSVVPGTRIWFRIK